MNIYKNISMLLTTILLSWNVSAALITTDSDQVSYSTGDTVLVDVFVTQAGVDLIWLEFDLAFDDVDLAFERFSFDPLVEDNTFYLDAFDWGMDDFGTYISLSPLTIQVYFMSANPIGESFKLGTAQFIALANVIPDFELTYLDVQAVPEPSTIFILLLGLGILLSMQRKSIQ